VSRYLLDTNTVIHFFKGIAGVTGRWALTPPSSMQLSAISLYELQVGMTTSTMPERRRIELLRILDYIQVIPFGLPEAEKAAQIRADLQTRGKMIGPLDVLIAATALVHELVLVTHDTDEFSRVSHLLWEDWWSA
jgi:tRNA(fMet)-specific endonuclease VapC